MFHREWIRIIRNKDLDKDKLLDPVIIYTLTSTETSSNKNIRHPERLK